MCKPDLRFQEEHVSVQRGVRRRQDSHGLHARSPLDLTLNLHVFKTRQAKRVVLLEIAAEKQQHQIRCNSIHTKKGMNEMFYFTTDSTHFILRLYGVGYMVKDHLNSERGNLLLPHGLHFPINIKGSFICTIPQTR